MIVVQISIQSQNQVISECEPRILCILPCLPSELKIETLQSIWKQTVPVTFTVILTEKVRMKHFPSKMSHILNNGLEHIKLEDFDYILRVDSDITLPENFLEKNLKNDPDACGYGYAQLIKISSFVTHMDGKFNKEHDDSYVLFKFMSENLNVKEKYDVHPVLKRHAGVHHGYGYFINRGKDFYKMGFEPVHILCHPITCHAFDLFSIIGFFIASFRQIHKFDFADFITYRQLKWVKNPRNMLNLVKSVEFNFLQLVRKIKNKMLGRM